MAILLPAAKRVEVAALPPLPEPRLDAAGPIVPLQVLVADDDEWTRNLMRSYVLGEGFELRMARGGTEALEQIFAAPPDIVLLDVAMPGTSGLEVLGRIREAGLDTAVIISTAYGSEEVVAEALRRGADDYLRKPFDKVDFLAVLDRTTARQLLRRQNTALRGRLLEHQRRIEDELAQAAAVVAELMPAVPPLIRGFELSAASMSARDVGGDFYDWQRLPSGALSLTVGDVMGKGLSAALLMATVRAVVRGAVTDRTPAAAVQHTASVLDDDLARSGSFVTLFHAQIDPDTATIRYVDAGHGYVLLLRAGGGAEDLHQLGLPLGIDGFEAYSESTLRLHPGDALLIYSDGVGEARPDIFGSRDRVAAYARTHSSAAALVEGFLEEVRHVRPLPDDLTVVALRRLPLPSAI